MREYQHASSSRATRMRYRFPKLFALEAVDAVLEELRKEAYKEIQLPTKVSADALGAEVALTQTVATWMRNSPEGALRLYAPAGEEGKPQLDRFVSSVYGFTAALMAAKILSNDGATDLTRDVYSRARLVSDRMWAGVATSTRGHRGLQICADHTSMWKLPSLYFHNGEVREPLEFGDLARQMVERQAGTQYRATLSADFYRSVGSLLYELFRNTHEWARAKADGELYSKSVRGLVFKVHKMEGRVLERLVSDSPLQGYVYERAIFTAKRNIRCLEISVFDTGPGLADRWLGGSAAKVTLQQEYEACMHCLGKHRTTSRHENAGMGLYRVLRLLTPLEGFLRVRSGRLCLYRDFVKSPLSEGDMSEHLSDWSGRQSLTERPTVSGCTYTMIIPLAPC